MKGGAVQASVMSSCSVNRRAFLSETREAPLQPVPKLIPGFPAGFEFGECYGSNIVCRVCGPLDVCMCMYVYVFCEAVCACVCVRACALVPCGFTSYLKKQQVAR